MAAIDLHDNDLIKDCLLQLETKFPNSSRVKKLKVMAKIEMRERFEDALSVYDNMIKKDESNSVLYKRKIAILIASRRNTDAIRELTEYLKKWMNDQEAWLELCDLYIQEQDYAKAAFCVEELILTSPHNHMYHERYAEIQYTINTSESLELARAYFAHALKLNVNNIRALYGLFLTANALATQPKCTSQKRKEHLRLASWASSQVIKAYNEVSNDKQQISSIEGMIANLQINSAN